MASYERQVRAAERQAELEQWADLNRQMLALAFVHEDEFPEATAPLAPPPAPVDEQQVVTRHERERLAGISILRRTQRRAAKEQARMSAEQEVAQERTRRETEHDSLQASLDKQWQLLISNDRHEVFESIEAAFEDNEMPAAPIDVHGAAVTLLMKILSPNELIPEREVTQTPTGRPTHKRRTKSVINRLYAEIMASHVVATAKEALATAPGLDEARVLVIRADRLGGGPQLIPLYAGEFKRQDLDRADWHGVNVLRFIEVHGTINYKGQAQEVAPLPTKSDPELRATLDEIASHLDWKPAP